MAGEGSPFARVTRLAREADHDVVDAASGDPDWEPPAGVREGLREYADAEPREFQYPPNRGLDALRDAIAARRQVDPDAVVVTAGATEANYLAMAAALERDAGDEVLFADPAYTYYGRRAEMLGGRPRTVAAGPGGDLDPAAVRTAAGAETACIVVNTPNNPTGAVYDAPTMRDLVAVAEAHDAVLVSDEVYHHLDRSGQFASALAVDSDHRVVTTAFSKSFAATGLRVGYAVLPEPLRDAATDRHVLTVGTASRADQRAVLRGIETVDPAYFADVRSRLADRLAAFTAPLDDAGVAHTDPDGGVFVLVESPERPATMDTVEDVIADAGVACMPGSIFGDAAADWLRVGLVTDRAGEAGERLAGYLRGRTDG